MPRTKAISSFRSGDTFCGDPPFPVTGDGLHCIDCLPLGRLTDLLVIFRSPQTISPLLPTSIAPSSALAAAGFAPVENGSPLTPRYGLDSRHRCSGAHATSRANDRRHRGGVNPRNVSLIIIVVVAAVPASIPRRRETATVIFTREVRQAGDPLHRVRGERTPLWCASHHPSDGRPTCT